MKKAYNPKQVKIYFTIFFSCQGKRYFIRNQKGILSLFTTMIDLDQLNFYLWIRMSCYGEHRGFIELHRMPRIWIISSRMATRWVQMMMIIPSVGMTSELEPRSFFPRFNSSTYHSSRKRIKGFVWLQIFSMDRTKIPHFHLYWCQLH